MTFDWVTTNGNVKQAQLIKEALRTVHDPEIHINVHDLGLIYKMDVDNDNNVDIIMTLTSAFCPVAGEMPIWTEQALLKVPGINKVDVQMTFEPTFNPSQMSEIAQFTLNLGDDNHDDEYVTNYHRFRQKLLN